MIKTWEERCVEHPDHQTGMVSYAMIQARMQEEIDELRAAVFDPDWDRVKALEESLREHMAEIQRLKALRAALAQPEQEPVAWNWVFDGKDYGPAYYGKPPDADITKQAEQRGRTVRLLYTTPPQRKPLTDQEIIEAIKHISHNEMSAFAIARAIERVLKCVS